MKEIFDILDEEDVEKEKLKENYLKDKAKLEIIVEDLLKELEE